jgi:predicted RNA-binding Zn ribbon-like protein
MNFESPNADAISKLSLVGGRTCLDFTNTVNLRESDLFRDRLASYGDLLHWAVHAGIITAEHARRLNSEAGRNQEEAARTLRRAIELREVIFRMFSAMAAGRGPSDEDLALFNRHFSKTMSRASMIREKGRYTIGFDKDQTLDAMLPPITWSAAELLSDPASARIKECAGETCGWLFVDTSKNHSRRWCEMRDCGNRAKAQRHYQKLRRGSQRRARTPIRPRPREA